MIKETKSGNPYQAQQALTNCFPKNPGIPAPPPPPPAMYGPALGGDTYARDIEEVKRLDKMVRLAQMMTNVTLKDDEKYVAVSDLVNKLVALDRKDPKAVDELVASFEKNSAAATQNPIAFVWMWLFDTKSLEKKIEEIQTGAKKELNDRMKRAGL
ncbi:MAG: hypothetical protein VKS61_03320 [Candidatus Sericytochromatia bacterium]|nr:hypothetical protein [Candidatus Sericytochromatia bacterium]